MGWDGMGWDGMGWDGMGWVGEGRGVSSMQWGWVYENVYDGWYWWLGWDRRFGSVSGLFFSLSCFS